MKLLTSFQTFTATASSSQTGFPVTNIQNLDPQIRWKASTYLADQSIVFDFAAPAAPSAIFLNKCNFAGAVVQGNTSDSWGTPAFTQAISLVKDRCLNRKGWFALTGFSYRYMRILIAAGQTLDNSESTPAIGNVLLGIPADLPRVNQFNAEIVRSFTKFLSKGGSLSKTPYGLMRHVVSAELGGSITTFAALDRTWTIGVLFADLGNVWESYLVYPPENWPLPLEGGNIDDCRMNLQMEERP